MRGEAYETSARERLGGHGRSTGVSHLSRAFGEAGGQTLFMKSILFFLFFLRVRCSSLNAEVETHKHTRTPVDAALLVEAGGTHRWVSKATGLERVATCTGPSSAPRRPCHRRRADSPFFLTSFDTHRRRTNAVLQS